MIVDRFVPFGAAHLTALAFVAACAAGLGAFGWFSREKRLKRRLGALMAGLILGDAAAWFLYVLSRPDLPRELLLPLHLCQIAAFLTGYALLTWRRSAYELAYFWVFAAGSQTMLTPDLRAGFTDPGTVHFFVMHGAPFAGVVFLMASLRARHDWSSVLAGYRRAFVATHAYLAAAVLANQALGTNFGYLARKPGGASLLDWLGPWPWNLVGLEAVGTVLFFVCYLPFLVHRLNARLDEPASSAVPEVFRCEA